MSLKSIQEQVSFLSTSHLDTAQSWLATGESIVGIVIASLFAVVLIQRLFSR